jgi:hypothetical protein
LIRERISKRITDRAAPHRRTIQRSLNRDRPLPIPTTPDQQRLWELLQELLQGDRIVIDGGTF